MNKSELAAHVAQAAGLSKNDATAAVDAVIGGITESLSKGENVSLIGFGTFAVSERAARSARNPRTGDPIEIPASKVARFKVGKSLKDAINK